MRFVLPAFWILFAVAILACCIAMMRLAQALVVLNEAIREYTALITPAPHIMSSSAAEQTAAWHGGGDGHRALLGETDKARQAYDAVPEDED